MPLKGLNFELKFLMCSTLVRNNFPGIFKPCWGQHLIDMISTNFMKQQLYLSILFSLFGLSVYAQRTQELFDASWKFSKTDVAGGETVNLNDAGWRTVELPHDWSVEDLPDQSDSVIGPFSKKSIGRTATGYAVGGIGWYRKHFRLGSIANKKFSIYYSLNIFNCTFILPDSSQTNFLSLFLNKT